MVLRNTDSPDLPVARVREAIAALQPGRVVLGPDAGGGYYLIGMTGPCREVVGIAVEGAESVFEVTRRRVDELGWDCHVLAEHEDVDTFDDLLGLVARRQKRRRAAAPKRDSPR